MKKFLKFLFCVILIAISIGLLFVGNGYKMYQEAIESLSLVQNSISMSDIDRICAMIYEAKKVHMLGYQFNKIISSVG